jgi:uncharacterized membrane protein YeaQ/YmgE (transglycosylase-associated protein family)
MQASLLMIGILVGGFVFGNLARLIVPGSQRLTWSETTLVGIAGAAVGAVGVNLATPGSGPTEFQWGTMLGVLGGSILVLVVVNFMMNRFGIRQPQTDRLPAAELIVAGESHEVEFKQTARWNVHTGGRDPKIELVIAKTVAGFLNADGGTLLIGVNDSGETTGLSDDLGLMKQPDLDRYELWLGDHLERCLGKPALRSVAVLFEAVGRQGHQICRIDVEPSPEPVFLDEPGGSREADMYVRMGNSTRKLLTDEAFDYSKHHWG